MVVVLRALVAARPPHNVEVVTAGYLGYEHRGPPRRRRSSAAMRSTRCPTSGRRWRCGGSHDLLRPGGVAAPPRPRLRLRAVRGAGADRPLDARRRRRSGRAGTPRPSSRRMCARSTARSAGCSSRCSTTPGSTSSTSAPSAASTPPTPAADGTDGVVGLLSSARWHGRARRRVRRRRRRRRAQRPDRGRLPRRPGPLGPRRRARRRRRRGGPFGRGVPRPRRPAVEVLLPRQPPPVADRRRARARHHADPAADLVVHARRRRRHPRRRWRSGPHRRRSRRRRVGVARAVRDDHPRRRADVPDAGRAAALARRPAPPRR